LWAKHKHRAYRCSDGKEVTAASPTSVDDVGDLAVRVEAEVPSRLVVARVQDLVLNKSRYPQDKRFTDAFLSMLSKIRKKSKERGQNGVLIPLSFRV
jgi:hypothetical protein